MDYSEELTMFCHNVRELRKKHGLSKVKMACVMGISVQTLSNMENGKLSSKSDLVAAANLAECLGLSLTALFSPLKE